MRAPVLSLALLACSGPSPVQAPPAVRIEASPDDDAPPEAKPFDAGRPELRACLDRATCENECAARCRAHDHDACVAIAQASDITCRRAIGRAGCELGHMPSCFDLGVLLSGIAPRHARRPLERACNHNFGEACLALGRLDFNDPERRGQAVARFERSCELGAADGCVLASQAYRNGDGVDRNHDRGLELLESACRLGTGDGCYELAKLLLADPAQRPKAISLLEQTCAHKPKADGHACFHLFTLMPTPHAKALQPEEVLDKACEKGFRPGCERAADYAYGQKDWPRVVTTTTTLLNEHNNQYWTVWFHRAMAQLNLGKPKLAVPDLEQLCVRRRDWDHCALWLWAARKRSGITADPALTKRRKMVVGARWPAPVMDHFLGQLSATQLLATAKSPDARVQKEQLCEAHYYIGMRRLIRGDKTGAKRSFERTIQFQITSFIEHMRALAELDRLASSNP